MHKVSLKSTQFGVIDFELMINSPLKLNPLIISRTQCVDDMTKAGPERLSVLHRPSGSIMLDLVGWFVLMKTSRLYSRDN